MLSRQHILLGVFVAGLVSYLGYWGYDSLIAQRVDSKTKAIERARKTATSKKREVIESRAAKLQLEKWRKLSLPSDPNVATSQYQAFLLDLLEQCDFDHPTINPGSASLREQTYWRIPFEVHARGSLESLVTFLDAFYHTQLLHKLTQLSMTPIEVNQKESLEVRFTIEALALTADASRKLPSELSANGSDAGGSKDLGPLAGVVERNLLMRQGPGPAGRPSYHASQVFLTGTILSEKQPEALLYNRATGESLTCHLGDQVSAGDVRGELVDITTTEIVLDVSNQWFAVALGDNLAGRKPLTPEEAVRREVRRAKIDLPVKSN